MYCFTVYGTGLRKGRVMTSEICEGMTFSGLIVVDRLQCRDTRVI